MADLISSWFHLRAAEKPVLAAVRAHRFGPHLFLADPARFLRATGFEVAEGFAAQLRALPGVRMNPAGSYEEIEAGRHPMCKQSIVISSLGLPPGLGDRP